MKFWLSKFSEHLKETLHTYLASDWRQKEKRE